MQNKNFFKILSSFMLIAVIFAGCAEKGDKNIQLVKNGSMDSNPNVPIGKAFDQFFSNGKWTSFTTKNDEEIVEFNGRCLFLDVEEVSVKIQFEILNKKRFSLVHMSIDGENLDATSRNIILSGILEDYKP